MAYRITETCTACGLCVPVCPVSAIEAGDPYYRIDPVTCVDFADCVPVCPVDAIHLIEELEHASKQGEGNGRVP